MYKYIIKIMKRRIQRFVFIVASLFLIIFLYSCEPTTYEKPFIIVDKTRYNSEWVEYTYVDKNGYQQNFSDTDKYDIGDTLK